MAGESQALQWMNRLDIRASVELLPALPHDQMADVFRRAQVLVSAAIHDGMPIPCSKAWLRMFPIAGDLDFDSRMDHKREEWPAYRRATDPQKLADAILEGLANKNLRDQAAGLNQRIIMERAEYGSTMKRVEEFYQKVKLKT